MRALVCTLVGLAVFAGCTAAWWFYWPVWQVEMQVKRKLPASGVAAFSNVTYNRSTRTGCGYLNATGAPRAEMHFILMPDGSLKFDPDERVQGSTLQQLEVLRRHVDYLALVYARCAPT
ncbi:hypothetical protein [Variovorax sp. PBL-E5]|uniref:hypothetical protein n=1 Tax=Variovorax sp. PBL-E5 TaxID=434014 RepID=UPI0013189805|nr:hypothetical protein [Variovorax sp. PBL-E5]VTU35983.1 hypothetical protein E5CHR_04201 [Variovorax sp. PBL-E5]